VPSLAQSATSPNNPSEIDWPEEARSTAIHEKEREVQERRSACSLEKPPARGDLFDHMRDAPQLGTWKEH
jgi:hypothetical protein